MSASKEEPMPANTPNVLLRSEHSDGAVVAVSSLIVVTD